MNKITLSLSLNEAKILYKKATSDLIYIGDDDPSELYTKKQLLEEGYDKEEIDGMSVEVNKGEYYFCPIDYKPYF